MMHNFPTIVMHQNIIDRRPTSWRPDIDPGIVAIQPTNRYLATPTAQKNEQKTEALYFLSILFSFIVI